MADTVAYYLNESDLAKLKQFIRMEMNTRRNNERQAPGLDILAPTPDVHIAYAATAIQPMNSVLGTAGDPAGTGSTYYPNSLDCDIYQVDYDTGELIPTGMDQVTVYNTSETATAPGWMIVHRTKFGVWVAGLGSGSSGGGGNTSGYIGNCACFECISGTDASITTCGSAPNGAAPVYKVDLGTWILYPTLAGIQYLSYVGGCTWTSPLIPISAPGTGSVVGTGTAGISYYQWVYTIAGLNTTLQLTLVYGADIAGVIQ